MNTPLARYSSHALLVLMLWLGLGWAADSRAQAAASALPSFTLTVKDGVFSPKRLEVPAGQRFKIVLRNEGPGPLEFENADLNIEKILGAGAESFVVIKLPPGEHEFVDEFNMVTGVMTVIAK